MFSSKRGPATDTPSRLVIPGPLRSDGVREASDVPTAARKTGDKRLTLDARSPRDIEHAHANARLDGQERGPVDPAERLPEVIDARGVQIRKAVAVHVHPDLDDPDQLHQIRDGLPQPVAVPDDRPRCGSADPFVIRR